MNCSNEGGIHSAQSLMENRSQRRAREIQKRQEDLEDSVLANEIAVAPMIDELRALVKELQDQNAILQNQIESAEKDARIARRWSLISFLITTGISLGALVISYLAYLK